MTDHRDVPLSAERLRRAWWSTPLWMTFWLAFLGYAVNLMAKGSGPPGQEVTVGIAPLVNCWRTRHGGYSVGPSVQQRGHWRGEQGVRGQFS